MSSMGLRSRPPPRTGNVWNNLTSTIQSKLITKLKRFGTVKGAMAQLNSVFRRRISRRHKGRTRRLHHHHRSFVPVYVNELYSHPKPVCVEHVEAPAAEKGGTSMDDCGSSLGGLGEMMGDVDVRAEMFIRRFKEEMRLQRQRSFGEYQEMLARGV